MNRTSKRLTKAYDNLEILVFYKIGSRVLFPQNETALILGVATRRLQEYKKTWLQEDKLSINQLPLFDIVKVIDGYRSNVQTEHRDTRPQIQENNQIPEDLEAYVEQMKKMELLPEKYLPADELKRRREYKALEQDTLKTAMAKGELIEADKIDFAKAEVSIMVISHLRSFKKIIGSLLSPILKPNKKNELAKIVDGELKKTIDGLNEFTNVQIPTEDNVYFWDIIFVIIEQLKKGTTPKQLIERLINGGS